MAEAAFDLGFLGGGQLARMSIQAAQRMGLTCTSLDPDPLAPASQIAPALAAPLQDPDAIARLAHRCRFVTLENEFIPASAIREAFAKIGKPEAHLLPGVDCLATIQDKLYQREAYERAGLPSPRAVPIANMAELGYPVVLKSRFGGYDGKGVRILKAPEDLPQHLDILDDPNWMAEAFVPFDRELAVMVYRSGNQEGAFPTMETRQTNHVCDLVFPSGVDASEVAIEAVKAIGGYGLFGVELFELVDGSFVLNEIAPRPHNTGHYTLDWGGVSQFEQHVRLVMGYRADAPIGLPTAMANLLGQTDHDDFQAGTAAALERDPTVHVHWYGKAKSKPGRKMGHLNRVSQGEDPTELAAYAGLAREALYRAVRGDLK